MYSHSASLQLQEACGPYGWGTTALVSSSANLIPLDGLPPILTSTGVKGGRASSNLEFQSEK